MLSKGEAYMLKSCNRCGKIHDFNKTCYKNRQVRGKTKADEFRKTNKWHQKSLDIRERDKNLCRCCMADIFNTQHIFNFNKLEVHHITPLEEDYEKRLDDDNLIDHLSETSKSTDILRSTRIRARMQALMNFVELTGKNYRN